MQYGMIGYHVPLERFPDTYNGQPLAAAALASQKRHMALYLMGVYGDEDSRFREQWQATGKKLDMGKSCIRFKRADQLAQPALAVAIASTPAEAFIAEYEASRAR